jgi:putative protease
MGRIQGGDKNRFLIPRENLLPGDNLRIGYEDQKWHHLSKVNRYVPQKGRLFLKLAHKNTPPKGTPVFLVDRREKALQELIKGLENEQRKNPMLPRIKGAFQAKLPSRPVKRKSVRELRVFRTTNRPRSNGRMGLWLNSDSAPGGAVKNTWWWLPPVVWPDEAKSMVSVLKKTINKGARHFVLNAPWQINLFNRNKGRKKALKLWAGPFCNISNPLAIKVMAKMGFSGAIISPELGKDDYLELPKHSALPLGIIVSGNWPLCVARITGENIKLNQSFTSPKGEHAWVTENDSTFWVYPNWVIDLTAKKNYLKSAGYSLFVTLKEPVPRDMSMKKRQGIWNWELGLK